MYLEIVISVYKFPIRSKKRIGINWAFERTCLWSARLGCALWQRPHTLPNLSVRTVTTEAVFQSAMPSQSTPLPRPQQLFKKNMQKKLCSLHGGYPSLYISQASLDVAFTSSTPADYMTSV